MRGAGTGGHAEGHPGRCRHPFRGPIFGRVVTAGKQELLRCAPGAARARRPVGASRPCATRAGRTHHDHRPLPVTVNRVISAGHDPHAFMAIDGSGRNLTNEQLMGTQWNWPGARWWRVDLHAHSPASHDFGSEADRGDPDWVAWITAARDAGLDAIAVTDHNTAAGIAPLQDAASRVENGPVLFPGVEVTASDGVHLLVLFDPACSDRHVEDFLSRVKVPVDNRGDETARSSFSVEQILDECPAGALIVGPHVNQPRGLLDLSGQERRAVLRHASLAAVEVVPDYPVDKSWIDGSKSEIGRSLPRLWNSDSHALDQVGHRFTWIKMTRPDAGGLRLALLDGDDSVRPTAASDVVDPNSHAVSAIESIGIRNARYLGRSEPLTVPFNPWFNTIIGGRGTGKSTLVDFCRTALRRDGELEGHDELWRAFRRRLQVPRQRGEEGLLTDATTIELIYRKDGARFALSWNREGSVPSIARLEGASRIREEGDIRERFPVRIYSQKQLFEVARNPDALLAVIDDTDAVDGAGMRRRSRELSARYLALRSDARALRAEAAELPDRNAALSDVRRRLKLLQSGEHAAALKQYRKLRRHDESWRSIRQQVLDGIGDVGRSVDELAVADLDQETDAADEPAATALRTMHDELRGVVASLQESVRAAMTTAAERIREPGNDANDVWRKAVAASAKAYGEAGAQLEAAGISSPAGYRDLLDQQNDLQREIARLEHKRTTAREQEEAAASVLRQYREVRAGLSGRRERFANETSSDLVRIRIGAAGDRGNLPRFLRDNLGIAHFDQDHAALAQRIDPQSSGAWTWHSLDRTVGQLHAFIGGKASWDARDGRFERALKRLQPEQIDRLALYVAEDAVTVSFRDQRQPGRPWKPLAQGSPGQQTAALLAFVLGYGVEPIILDQPEDDLDNALIYELLVRRLREQKAHRQIIVVTHNPNIVVHGDAEFAMSLDTTNGQVSVVCSGGLQERTVRDEICRVMEGGRDAFRTRYRRIMPGSRT